MTGTVIVTIIPLNDIGSVGFEPPIGSSRDTWTVIRLHSALAAFPETMTSPLPKPAKKVLPAVNFTTARNVAYFAFPNSAEAHDAYPYFLYHKQRGR